MSSAGHALHMLARPYVGQFRPLLLLGFVALGIVISPSMARAQQLNLSWVDNSGGQAGFIA